MTKSPDILLVFPPLSEATQFPYLSLPQLAASWRRIGIQTETVDLNLRYRDAVLDGGSVADLRPAEHRADPAATYQRLSLDYLVGNGDELRAALRAGTAGQSDVDAATAAAHRYLTERAAKDSWIVPEGARLDELDAIIEASAGSWSTQRSVGILLERLPQGAPPPILGFSVPFFSQVIPTLAISSEIKRAAPGVRVLLGGPTIQMWGRQLAAELTHARHVDHWWFGHGEMALVNRGGNVSVAVADGGLSDGFTINDQAMPDFSDIDLTSYANGNFQFPYRLTLGCYWGRCTFCSYGNRYRDARAHSQITPAIAAGHLGALQQSLGLGCVAVGDENVSLRHLLRVMRECRRGGSRLSFRVRARLEPELLNTAFCADLARNGCTHISAGLEVADNPTLDFLDKGLTVEQAEQAALNAVRAGIAVNLSYLDGPGGPNDTAAHAATRRFILEHADDFGLDTLQLAIAEPGGKLRPFAATRPALATNQGLAFAAGRVGPAAVGPGQAAAARSRLMTTAVTAIPTAERQARPDLRRPDRADAVYEARLRIGATVGQMGPKSVLADLSWPALIAMPAGIALRGKHLAASGETAALWLGKLAARGVVTTLRRAS